MKLEKRVWSVSWRGQDTLLPAGGDDADESRPYKEWVLFRGYGEVIDPQQGVINHARTKLPPLRAAFRSGPDYFVTVHNHACTQLPAHFSGYAR